MKILKLPKFEIIRCNCGCIFEIENESDIENTEIDCMFADKYKYAYTICPFCGRKHDVEIKNEKGGN